MRQIITNISKLYHGGNPTNALSGGEMSLLPCLEEAWVMVEGDTIIGLGAMTDVPDTAGMQQYDASGRLVLPAWCDSHTHLVFAASREREFVDRIKGVSYEEIARRGGGILNSAKRLNETNEEQLYDMAVERLEAAVAMGTGAIEIKSGYGLTVEGELKMLRVIKRLKENSRVAIKATLLAAHAYPQAYRENHQGYISLIIDTILPEVAAEGLADYMDVFCEQGFFSVEDTDKLLSAAAKYGLKPKIHANQLHYSGGVQVGVRHNAISVDHLECVGEAEIQALKAGNTMPTLLPGAAFFLGIQYQPARSIIDAGLPVCLATDFNPGSCPSSSVPLLLSIACTQLKMTPEETINAVTINGAVAMELLHHYGTIAPGKKANLIITKPLPDVACIPYYFGSNPVERVLIGGHFA